MKFYKSIKKSMGYYVSNLIGIRIGGVFGGKTDIEDVKKRIAKIVLEMRGTDFDPDLGDEKGDISHCLSKELEAHKGTYLVIGGVFNYWTWNKSQEFSKRLSKEFGTEVMHACWNEETNDKNFEIFLDGKLLDEVNEKICNLPLGSIIRRVS